MNSKTKGILCIVTAAFCFAFMSLCVRLAGDLPSMQKILFRNLLAFFIVGAGLVRKPEKLEIHKGDLKFLFLRSICGTVGIVCNFYAIDHLVLSDANMLNKLSPFFTIIFSFHSKTSSFWYIISYISKILALFYQYLLKNIYFFVVITFFYGKINIEIDIQVINLSLVRKSLK